MNIYDSLKCRTCGANLRFDIVEQKMKCDHCGNLYEVSSVEYQEEGNVREENTSESDTYVRVFRCNSCGGEMVSLDTQVSSRCPYCGQFTVSYTRMEEDTFPQQIIPFKVTREQAVSVLRNRLKSSFFVPEKMKHFSIEHLHGVYLPFGVYHVGMDARVTYFGDQSDEYQRHFKKRFYRRIYCEYDPIYLYAADHIQNTNVIMLSDYDQRYLKPFHPGYLSGFVADCRTMTDQEMIEYGRGIGGSLIMDEVRDTSGSYTFEDEEINIDVKNERISYALLPAWIITLQYKKRNYSMIINGENGHLVGTLPYSKCKKRIITILLYLLFSIVFIVPTMASVFLGKLNPSNPWSFLSTFMLIANVVCALAFGIISWFMSMTYRNYKEVTENDLLYQYTKEREMK